MTDQPRRLMLQRTGPRFAIQYNEIVIERRILIEAHQLLVDHIPHLSAAVRCALRQALEKQA